MNAKWGYVFICAVIALTSLFTSNRVIAAPTNPRVLHAFCNGGPPLCTDEQAALGRVPQGIVAGPDGAYYGTTTYSAYDFDAGGVVYRADPVTRKLSVLYQFSKDYYPTAWIKADLDGNLYGGYVHRIDESNKWLSEGLFRISPTGEFSVIVDETKYKNFVCNAPVRDSLGNWIGSLPHQGNNSFYKLTPGGGFKLLLTIPDHSYYCPTSEPVLAADGNLYGIVLGGVDGGTGEIYRLAPDDTFTVVHRFFRGTDGVPVTPLTLGPDGALYGTLWLASTRVGSLYRMSPEGQYTDMGAFGPANLSITAKLTLMPDGQFYGSARVVDPQHQHPDTDVLFRLSPAGEYTQLYVNTKNVYQGDYISTMIRGFDNALYGTDPYGGKYLGGGTLFRYLPPPMQ